MYKGLAASYARRLPSVTLLRRATRGKPLGFPLKIAEICFVSSKQIPRAYLTAIYRFPPQGAISFFICKAVRIAGSSYTFSPLLSEICAT